MQCNGMEWNVCMYVSMYVMYAMYAMYALVCMYVCNVI